MAEITTTVHSPRRAIHALPGRVPAERAFQVVRQQLQEQIEAAQADLSELSNWYTTAERGKLKVKKFEEMPWDDRSS